MHPNFKQNVLAQAIAIACLSMAHSGAYAVPACSEPSSGTISISAGTVVSCELNGAALQVISSIGETKITNVTNTAVAPISNPIIVTEIGGATASIGNLSNNGVISGFAGVYLNGSGASIGNISNSGTISSTQMSAISIHQGHIETITNHGNILGTNDNGIHMIGDEFGNGIMVANNSSIGTLDNRGEIRGENAGIQIFDNSRIAEIYNSGTIVGEEGIASIGYVGYGIASTGYGMARGGYDPLLIVNQASGKIQGTGGTAINFESSAIPATINNFGQIIGDVKLGGGTILGFGFSPLAMSSSGSTLNLQNASVVTGKVTGGFSSTVNVLGAVATQNTFDVGQFNISRDGKLAMNHDITVQTQPGLHNDGVLSVVAGNIVKIHGSYVQGPDAVFETAVTGTPGATQYGKLEVTGTADLSIGNRIGVAVTSENTIESGVLPGVLKAGKLVMGPVGTTVVDNSALWNFTALKNGNSIDLKTELAVVPEPTPVPTPTPQPQPRVGTAPMIQNTGIGMPAIGAARVIDQFLVAGNASGDMQTVLNNLGALGTQQEVAQAVSQLVPVMTGALAQSTLGAMHGTNRVVQARMEAAHGLSSGDEVKTNHGWIKPFGSWANQGDQEGVSGYRSDTYGFVLGADKEVTRDTRLGAAFSYSNTRVKSNADASAKVDTYQAIVYGSHSLDERTEVNFQADMGMNSNDTSRRISFADLNRSANANYNSWNTHLGVGVGRLYDIGAKATFTPSLRADYLYIRDKGYTESGADALDLEVNGKSTDELVLGVDGKFNYALTDVIDVTANLGVGYDALSGRSSITTAFVGGGAAFITEGADPSPWLGRGGVGLSTRYANGLEVAVRYDVEARKHFTNQTASLKLRMPF